MISAAAWIPRGAAKATPTLTEPTEEELAAMQAQLSLHDSDEEGLGDADDGDSSQEEDDDDGAMGVDGAAMGGVEDQDGPDEGPDDGLSKDAAAGTAGAEGVSKKKGDKKKEGAKDKGSVAVVADDMEAAAEEDQQAAVARARAMASAITSTSGGGGRGGRSGAADGGDDSLDAALRELDMDHYDDDDGDGNGVASLAARVLGSSTRGDLSYTGGPEGDPYITLGDNDDDDDDESIDDYTIRETDLVVIACKTEDDISNLEVSVYEEAGEDGADGNLYVHHDIMLQAFPLCLAWLNCDPRNHTAHGNLAAVGTMDPGIEIWDLDVIDAVEPVASLGGYVKPDGAGSSIVSGGEPESEDAGEEKKRKKKSKSKKAKAAKPKLLPGSHTDAVMGLSWNKEYRNVLASGSADSSVKVWDIARQACEHTLTHHSNKVQAVAWNPVETPVLLSASFDKTTCVADVRVPNGAPLRWMLSADAEALTWHPHDPTCFVVSSEDGIVACFDARKGAASAPVFRLSAHDKATCSLSFCPAVPGLLATASTDKKVKLWDVRKGSPTLVVAQDLKAGSIFTASFCADAPHLIAAGGSKGTVAIWDLRTCAAVSGRYKAMRAPASWAAADAAADAADDQ